MESPKLHNLFFAAHTSSLLSEQWSHCRKQTIVFIYFLIHVHSTNTLWKWVASTHAYLILTLSLADLLSIVSPTDFCAHGASETLYMNGVAKSGGHTYYTYLLFSHVCSIEIGRAHV